MQNNPEFRQTPPPNTKLLLICGQQITFTLEKPENLQGRAYLRTNLGKAKIRQDEIISAAQTNIALAGKDWWDIPMNELPDGSFSLTVALTETGYFAAKTLLVKPDGKVDWPNGDNVLIKVEPADTAAHNTIYTVFPRLFGEISKNFKHSQIADNNEILTSLDKQGYSVVPPSGTFRDVIKELDFIMGELGFRIIQLLPVHPVPTTFMRMGRYGSPFASLDFYNINSEWASQVRDATPMEQFIELIDQIHKRCGKVFLDLPANHTGWASALQIHHPEWFKRNGDGKFKSPGAWGVVWEDLCELDYHHIGLQNYMADVFLYWARQGVDGFRCDAGYMIPMKAWRFITAKVRNEFPDTVFMLEGLGGKLSVTEDLLSKANLNWAYSELFQNYSANQIRGYLNFCNPISASTGTLVHFAETHDNNRLASVSKVYAKMRTAISALFSSAGAFGITNGVEWFATEKVDVHNCSGLNWQSDENQVDLLKRLNILLKNHPCFEAGTSLRLLDIGGNETLAMLRTAKGGEQLLILVNLNIETSTAVSWHLDDFALSEQAQLYDLVASQAMSCQAKGSKVICKLNAGQVSALTNQKKQIEAVEKWSTLEDYAPSPINKKHRLHTIIQQAIICCRGFVDMGEYNIDDLAATFMKNPERFFGEIARKDGYVPVVLWEFPADCRRQIVLPPKHFLLATADNHFLAELVEPSGRVVQRSQSIQTGDGRFVCVINSFENGKQNANTRYTLRTTVYAAENIHRCGAQLLILGALAESLSIDIEDGKLHSCDDYALCCNELGAIGQVRARWAAIKSKYDAFLSANLNPNFPVDRHIMLTRIRGWVVYRDYSREISVDCQTSFTTDMNNKVSWRFDLPVGMGKRIRLVITLNFSKTDNSADIIFTRLAANSPDCLEDSEIIKLIIRPDIEDRCNHEVTKAYLGAEFGFSNAITDFADGFDFSPTANRRLRIKAGSGGTFTKEPQWEYMVGLPVEMQRGLEGSTDLFSPGHFKFKFAGDNSAVLRASISTPDFEPADAPIEPLPAKLGTKWQAKQLLAKAMEVYMVKRADYKTVIAGYPWFLDWGRDTFIALRGFISAGYESQSRQIINQFARFEQNGTIPNMIRGDDVSNRDTTDAPLWLFVAVNDYIERTGDESLLSDDCRDRGLLEVLISIAENYISGTPNGIIADTETMLIFSPAHFTWMDTNYPAATPREGYPIEIQALWFAALSFLAKYDDAERWNSLAEKVEKSITEFYPVAEKIGVADCLHCTRGTKAADARRDDILRPNQLFAVTLGAITDKAKCAAIINACSKLVIPAGIRSLADMPITYEQPVYNNGRLLNNPANPYFGVYGADEDTSRKPAYHNGTAWGWVFPSYCEALLKTYGSNAADAAGSIMMTVCDALKTGCIGQLPEIFDGDAPHTQRGCGAQAWSVTEAYRIIAILEKRGQDSFFKG